MKKIILLVGCLTFLSYINSYSQIDSTAQNTEKVNLPYGSLPKDKVVGAVDVISGKVLTKTPEYNVASALVGQASGLFVTKGLGGPGEYGATLKVRGNSRGGESDGALIVIDGIADRSLSSISVDEIESIVVLKDPVTKMMYGSKAANGVILVTTKRGYDGKKRVTVSGEYGIKTPTLLPEYLDAADYASYYRQAEMNDGKTNLSYADDDIAKYRNGSSPIHFPNVDYYDTFLKPNTNYQKVNVQLTGGDAKTKFFINLGYIGEGGLEAVGNSRSFNRLNLRSNLDYQVNEIVSVNLDISGRSDSWKGPLINSSDFFSALSSTHPNDYPLFVSKMPDTDSLGYSSRVGTNLYGELTRAGYNDQQDYYAQNNLGMDFDLNSLVKGLTASVFINFDISNSISTGKELTYSRLRADILSNGRDSLVRVGVDDLKGTQTKFDDGFTRRFGGVAKVDYVNNFGKHALQVNLASARQRIAGKTLVTGKSVGQDDKNVNVGLRLNYAYDDKYIVEATSSLMGSDKFVRGKRWGLYGAGGFGWIITKEEFLKSVSFINYLKLKGTYGAMGYDRNYDYLLNRDEFTGGGNIQFGINNSVTSYGQRMSQMGNPDLTFEESKELNVGFEGIFLKNHLSFEANYFNELRSGIPIQSTNVLPGYLLGTITAPMINYNEISNKGIDLSVSYNNSIGNLRYSLGGNFIYVIAKNVKYSELVEYDHLKQEGKVTDVIFGYVADGLYKSQAEIDASGVTSSIASLIPGDIRYVNITNDRNDNIIDSYDTKVIGNGSPRVNYALNLSLEYKGFSLYALGQGLTGFDRLLNNSYYENLGQSKYSVQVIGSAIPTDVASISNATHPRLTTANSGHSYVNSTYWLEDASFFKLRVLELSYALPQFVSDKIFANKTSFFIRGNDLFTLSKNKDIEPENKNAGISNYPMYRTLSVGLKLSF